MTLGEALKQHRKANGLSQCDIAKILGVSGMTISRIERESPARFNQDIAKLIIKEIGEDAARKLDSTTRNAAVVMRLGIGIPEQKLIGKVYALHKSTDNYISIPEELCKALDLSNASFVNVSTHGYSVNLKKYSPLAENRNISHIVAASMAAIGITDYALYDTKQKVSGSKGMPGNISDISSRHIDMTHRNDQSNEDDAYPTKPEFWRIEIRTREGLIGFLAGHIAAISQERKDEVIGGIKAIAAMIGQTITASVINNSTAEV